MISSLHITNFQSHEETHLNFHKGVNIIVGNTDAGKSAIIRALRRLIWNRPSGDSICSYWSKQTSVKLKTEGSTVLWIKGKTDSYVLVTPDGKKFTFKAIGTSVPDEISSILNINEINLQRQLDTHFLLSKPPAKVAQHFNKVAGLDKIDISIQNINSWIRELTNEIGKEAVKDKPATGLIKQKGDLEKEIKQFEHLTQFEAEVEVLEVMEKRLRSTTSLYNKLTRLIEDYLTISTQIKECEPYLELEESVDQILDWIKEKEKLEAKRLKLWTLIHNYKVAKEWMDEENKLLEVEPLLTDALALYEKKASVEKRFNQLQKAVNNFSNIQQRLKGAKATQARLQSEFDKSFPNICPLCGTKLK